jgi:hypothetical protein
MILIPDVILVPYSVDSWSVEELCIKRFSDGGIRLDAAFPCVAINKINKRPIICFRPQTFSSARRRLDW